MAEYDHLFISHATKDEEYVKGLVDLIATAELPEEIKHDMDSLAECISGASSIDEIKLLLSQSGFKDISVVAKDESREFIKDWIPGANIENYIVSSVIKGTK